LSDANNLADGSCGLSDGSSAGDWRLPNPMEIVSLTDFSRSQPMIPAGNPFTNVPTFNPSLYHWTSSNWLVAPQYTYMGGTTALGYYTNADKANAEFLGVWPVRDGGISQPDPVFENGFEGEDIPD
ncbi:MAG: DUF1566 domain-containing protein, partial [Xanthomonadales bacterium]|nr:DUF1566 domain-containing protein [Xanthomonadales bacterium]